LNRTKAILPFDPEKVALVGAAWMSSPMVTATSAVTAANAVLRIFLTSSGVGLLTCSTLASLGAPLVSPS